MNIFYAVLITYVLPALAGGITVKVMPKKEGLDLFKLVMTVVVLILSAVANQYFIYRFGYKFPWHPSPISLAAYVFSVVISFVFLGSVAVWYGGLVFIQQVVLQSVNFLLLQKFPVYLSLLLIVPLYVWGHTLDSKDRVLRTVLFFVWGIASILLFKAYPDIYLISAAHVFLGVLLIHKALLYPEVKTQIT